MVVVYIWIPPDMSGPGHTSLQVDSDTYISYWPCEDEKGNDKKENKQKKKRKKKTLGMGSDGFAVSESYDEDCFDVVRRAEYTKNTKYAYFFDKKILGEN